VAFTHSCRQSCYLTRLGGSRHLYSSLSLELASHGFVPAVEHRDGSACATFYAEPPADEGNHGDGPEASRVSWLPLQRAALDDVPLRNGQAEQRAAECLEAAETLCLLTRSGSAEVSNGCPTVTADRMRTPGCWISSRSAGRIDEKRIHLMGHSFGGASALTALSTAPTGLFRLLAAVFEKPPSGALLHINCSLIRMQDLHLMDCWMLPVGEQRYSGFAPLPVLFLNNDSYHWETNAKRLETVMAGIADLELKTCVSISMDAGFFLWPRLARRIGLCGEKPPVEATILTADICKAFIAKHEGTALTELQQRLLSGEDASCFRGCRGTRTLAGRAERLPGNWKIGRTNYLHLLYYLHAGISQRDPLHSNFFVFFVFFFIVKLNRKPSSAVGKPVLSTQSISKTKEGHFLFVCTVSPCSTPEVVLNRSDGPSGVAIAAVVSWYSALMAGDQLLRYVEGTEHDTSEIPRCFLHPCGSRLLWDADDVGVGPLAERGTFRQDAVHHAGHLHGNPSDSQRLDGDFVRAGGAAFRCLASELHNVGAGHRRCPVFLPRSATSGGSGISSGRVGGGALTMAVKKVRSSFLRYSAVSPARFNAAFFLRPMLVAWHVAVARLCGGLSGPPSRSPKPEIVVTRAPLAAESWQRRGNIFWGVLSACTAGRKAAGRSRAGGDQTRWSGVHGVAVLQPTAFTVANQHVVELRQAGRGETASGVPPPPRLQPAKVASR
uniref:1-alkyl-2-acetylglycerophosphocholine esterase n=1 Tax=Macrostomum lignano TaxID=282301 RepID=A0A1I8JR73_9PLAT